MPSAIYTLPRPLDPETAATRDLLYAAIDARLCDGHDLPMASPRPDSTTADIVALGTAAVTVTDDPLIAGALVRVLVHVADLSEQVQTTRMMLSGALALGHQHHRRVLTDQEARHAA